MNNTTHHLQATHDCDDSLWYASSFLWESMEKWFDTNKPAISLILHDEMASFRDQKGIFYNIKDAQLSYHKTSIEEKRNGCFKI